MTVRPVDTSSGVVQWKNKKRLMSLLKMAKRLQAAMIFTQYPAGEKEVKVLTIFLGKGENLH